MSSNSAIPWSTLMARCQDAKIAFIVAPYMKAGALEQVLNAVANSATITCVSRWTPQDIQLGTTDLDCRQLALNRDGTFLLHDRLHAKYYRFDDQILIGSSNLTRAGMNIPGTGNLEILCMASPEFDATQFESQLLQEAYTVSEDDFALWSQIVPIPQQNQTIPLHHDLNSADSWKPSTRRPEYLWLAYQQRRAEIPLEEQQEIASREVRTLGVPKGLTEQEFNNWIRLSLMTSPFVKSVLAGLDETREASWDRLSQRWNISKAEAERFRSTAQNWIAYFGMNTSQDEANPTEASPGH